MKLDLKRLYKQKIVPAMIEEFGYKNIEQVPKLVKISVNRGIGEASKNSKELEASVQELADFILSIEKKENVIDLFEIFN